MRRGNLRSKHSYDGDDLPPFFPLFAPEKIASSTKWVKKDCRRRGKIREIAQKFAFASFFFFVQPKVVSFMNLQLGFFFFRKIPTKIIDGKKKQVRLRTQQIYFCIGIGSDCGISYLCTPPTSHRSSSFFLENSDAEERRIGATTIDLVVKTLCQKESKSQESRFIMSFVWAALTYRASGGSGGSNGLITASGRNLQRRRGNGFLKRGLGERRVLLSPFLSVL